MTSDDLFRWFFEDRRTGRIVIGQSPNLTMLVFLAATASRAVAPHRGGAAGPAIRGVQAGSLFLWALDEALRGVNPFRRLGGLAVVALVPFRRMAG